MHLVVFEGSKWHTFAPLSLSRPVFALASGAGTLLDKHVRHLKPTRMTLWVRPALAEYCRRELAPRYDFPVQVNEPLDDEPAILVSGRTLHFSAIEHDPQPRVVIDPGEASQGLVRLAIVRMPGLDWTDAMNRTPRWMEILDLPHAQDQARMADYVWDLIGWNEESLVEDFVALHDGAPANPFPAGPYHMVHEESIWVGPDVAIAPGVVLDASKGPIILDRGCVIGANAVLQGPCFVGAYTTVKALCLIQAGTSIGPVCKIGGELSHSIIVGCSNKWHEGYLGDSYVGQWVNLGAGTTTSNLRNTYSTVRVRIGSKEFETGRRTLGSLIGDHAKTAIQTRLMTGSYIGYSSMIATSAIAPTFVPSLSFITDKGREPYRLDKALEVMKAMHARKYLAWPTWGEDVARYAAGAAAEAEG